MSRARAWALVAALLGVLLCLAFWPSRPAAKILARRAKPTPAATHPAPVVGPAHAAIAPSGPVVDAGSDAPTLWQSRLAEAQERLDRYLASTKYPPGSRPMREHPDQRVPMQHVDSEVPFRTKSGTVHPELRIVRDQLHNFVVGSETSMLSVVCEKHQVRIPTTVLAARAQAILPAKPETTSLRFVDDGQAPDAKAGDHVMTAAFQPATMGFASYRGRIGVEVEVGCDGLEGRVVFQVGYTPTVPATFTGSYREAVEAGSLNLYVGLQVRTAGHYVITGRINDGKGDFALVRFNGDVTLDQTEIKLTVFGKLLRDEKAVMPLHLRDLEGFLLFEHGDPDRETMQQVSGVAYTTQSHPLSAFSEAEWSSEEKTRYVTKFTEYVTEAKAEVAKETPQAGAVGSK